jgi:pilus assembly protein Flp/PilA
MSRKDAAGAALWEPIQAFLRDETGQDLVEYALIGALVALGSLVSVRQLATLVSEAFPYIASRLTSAI